MVFEMELAMRQMAGKRDEQQKVLLMDEVTGLHYVVKTYHNESVVFAAASLGCSSRILFRMRG